MNSVRTIRMLAMLTMIFAGGCAPLDDANEADLSNLPSYDTMAPGTTYEPPSGRNGLKPEQFWSVVAQRALRDMQNVPLEGSTRLIGGVQTSILNAPPGSHLKTLLMTYPKVVKELIECTLSSTQVIHDDVTGYDFYGWWGLHPDWLTTPISGIANEDAQRWITGCMLGRLNVYGVEVPILLEGDTPAIQTNTVWDPAFPYDESTVSGNMFSSTKPLSNMSPAFDATLCRENHLASVCKFDGGAAYARKRICDNVPSICGLIDIGLCDPTAPGSAGACIAGSTTQHWKCKLTAGSPFFEYRTVGVQLEAAIDPNQCY